MAENSGIAWTDNTFNPWWGCQKVSRACDGCYAEAFAKRTGFKVWGPKAERRFFGDKHWAEPVKWNHQAAERGTRLKVFCASMADVFEDRAELEPHRERLWDLIDHTPFLDWQLLTKRPQNMVAMAPSNWREGWPSWVWAGTTTENQDTFDERWEHLRKVPAAVRFVSIEPMIGPVDVRLGGAGELHQAIFGGESGPGHETLDIAALERSVSAARDRGCAIFVKQDSGPYPGRQGRIPDDLWALKDFPPGRGSMKALTVWQPWASLIAWPIKPVENRTWDAPWVLGKRIAIHAGNKFDEDAALHLSARPSPVPAVVQLARKVRGAIVCTAIVDRFVSEDDLLLLPMEEADSLEQWFDGPVGWVLRDVQKFEPVPARGAQGLWDVPAEVLARIPEQAR